VIRLAEVLDGVLAQTAPQAQALEVRIDVDEELALVELFCDPGQLERTLLNIVFNALDAVGSGGRVWIRAGQCRAEDDLFPIVVEDDGPGIDPAIAQRVFNPFFTTKDTGTGLGLAIVHRIIESHGGSVTAGRREGGGTAMVVRMPRACSESPAYEEGGTD
jgi:signal transduction histidine kinase